MCGSFGCRTFYFVRLNMTYEKEQLEQTNIHPLRNIAREVGVKSPTSLKKNVLIDEIIQIQSGKKRPHLSPRKGRPVKHGIEYNNTEHQFVENKKVEKEEKEKENFIDLEKKIKKELINSILEKIEKELNKLLY